MASRDTGKTKGITLRLDKQVLESYRRIALRANKIALEKGSSQALTPQDVMRHRLESLPFVRTQRKGNVG